MNAAGIILLFTIYGTNHTDGKFSGGEIKWLEWRWQKNK